MDSKTYEFEAIIQNPLTKTLHTSPYPLTSKPNLAKAALRYTQLLMVSFMMAVS